MSFTALTARYKFGLNFTWSMSLVRTLAAESCRQSVLVRAAGVRVVCVRARAQGEVRSRATLHRRARLRAAARARICARELRARAGRNTSGGDSVVNDGEAVNHAHARA